MQVLCAMKRVGRAVLRSDPVKLRAEDPCGSLTCSRCVCVWSVYACLL